MGEFISRDDLEAVRELLQLVTSNHLGEIDVTLADGAHVRIVTHAAVSPATQAPIVISAPAAAALTVPSPQPQAAVSSAATLVPPASSPGAERVPAASPMVGIFYSSPSPGEPAFVTAGERIQVGQTIGLIEAMKVFSEIPSEVAGRVVELSATDGDLVQLGQPLLYVEPS